MVWRQLSWECEARIADAASAWLEARGAVSVTLEDAADVPLYEPAPGEMPIWPRTRLIALFDRESVDDDLAGVLAAAFPGQGEPAALADLADRAWEREWLTRFAPMRFGERLWVCPGGQRPPSEEAKSCAPPAAVTNPRASLAVVTNAREPVVVELDPGLAFGTGTHPTTAMCLTWLDARDLDSVHCLDYGCGSGILAIAALKLGATHASAVDIDRQALTATQDNAERNGVIGAVSVYAPDELPHGMRVECVVANILAGQLEVLAPRLAELTAPGGALALSGVLAEQAETVAAAYCEWFEQNLLEELEGWVLIGLRRRVDVDSNGAKSA